MTSKELARTDLPYYVISLSDEQKSQKEYYKDEIAELKKTIKDYKKIINQTMEKRDYIEALEGFRKMLIVSCIIDNNKKTIIHCTDTIKRNDCKFHETCIERKRVLNLINL